MKPPTIYLTNAASRRPPQRGPGRVWTIMAAPRARYGEAGEGEVAALVPPLAWVRAAKTGELGVEEYRARYLELLAERAPLLGPRNLEADGPWGEQSVRDGDTLICACSREAAAAGRCHRVWAAEALAAAGWRVVLDGVEVALAQLEGS